ncbi:MAG TPA: amino acid transporter [Blastocatellia bacterium]|nr:amino acid transporter [Blastocatellia bacterium]
MCLTGVDYFSTLGYQPGIAFLAAGALSPIATLILILLTLLGALPIYSRVAQESPHGEGSISMLEHLLSRWKGKLFVLVLLGFVATDFIITITLSAADATAHIIENPFTPELMKHQVGVTLVLVALLGGIFLRGFKEAIGIAVILVGVYLLLNLVVIGFGMFQLLTHPHYFPEWKQALIHHPSVHGNAWLVVGISLILFPKLALGLSGFETGVAVMPLVKGDEDLTEADWEDIHVTRTGRPPQPRTHQLLEGRIKNTRRLLRTAALIMSVFLITSSLVTTMMIPPDKFQVGGEANGRALAYLAHHFFGDIFGSAYDLSTIAILWFAGASAMAGLLNIVPRYLPRYGMAPQWAQATRPLALVFTLIAIAVTLIFNADVDAQGGAYATGVLVLMTSAAVAVTLAMRRRGQNWIPFLLIAIVFAYTTIQNIHERPEGIKIASFFILAIITASLFSRVWRSTELRVERIELDDLAREFVRKAAAGTVRIIANRLDTGDAQEYEIKEREKRTDNHIPPGEPILFFEVTPGDASEFSGVLHIRGEKVDGHRVLRAVSPAVPNAIAAFLLFLRDETGKLPHVYFGWSEGNPLSYLLKYIAFGEGDTAPVTHEVLRQAEKNPERRPIVHVGG